MNVPTDKKLLASHGGIHQPYVEYHEVIDTVIIGFYDTEVAISQADATTLRVNLESILEQL